MMGDLQIRAGEAHFILAGGMECMSQAPYLIPKLRSGLRLGHGELVDSMIKDGLWDVYNNYHMGSAAELCVKTHNITRQAQDDFALESYRRAQNSVNTGLFADECVSVTLSSKKDPKVIDKDEEPFRIDWDKFKTLRPVFDPQGSVTAGNASTLNDGAASVLLVSESRAQEKNLKPMARIVAQATSAEKPEWFTTAPTASIKRALQKAGLKTQDIDLWEINEAFAAVALINMRNLELNPAKVNIRGGAIALGHPIGASGARILVTLCHSLAKSKARYGAASLCIGGGEATTIIIENLMR
jgi:acetyl-CoA C-acetyltransferase